MSDRVEVRRGKVIEAPRACGFTWQSDYDVMAPGRVSIVRECNRPVGHEAGEHVCDYGDVIYSFKHRQ